MNLLKRERREPEVRAIFFCKSIQPLQPVKLLGHMVILSSKLCHKMTDKQDNASSPQNTRDDISHSVKFNEESLVITADEATRIMNVLCG